MGEPLTCKASILTAVFIDAFITGRICYIIYTVLSTEKMSVVTMNFFAHRVDLLYVAYTKYSQINNRHPPFIGDSEYKGEGKMLIRHGVVKGVCII